MPAQFPATDKPDANEIDMNNFAEDVIEMHTKWHQNLIRSRKMCYFKPINLGISCQYLFDIKRPIVHYFE